jgi:hypothetical protein
VTLRCRSPQLAAPLEAWRDEGKGLVFVADDATGDAWSEVAAELTEAFHLAKQSLATGLAVVFVVHNDDLLGRNGPGRAIVATGLLSAARTAALEHRKAGVAVNVVAREEGINPSLIGHWCELLMDGELPTGELIHLGSEHLGKALP